MAIAQSTGVIKKIIDALQLSPGAEEIPSQVARSIVPVLVANPDPDQHIVASVSAAATGSNTIFTTPTDQDFFLTSVNVSNDSDVSATNTAIRVTATPRGGDNVDMIRIVKLTLTVLQANEAISYPEPILLDRGSAIQLINTFGAGASRTSATITGFNRVTSRKA